MRKGLPVKILCLFFCFLVNLGASGQGTDSALLAASLSPIINLHNQALGKNLHLYNGSENLGYNHLSNGNPYFIQDLVQRGDLIYEGTLYRQVPMLYDLVQDNVVIVRFNDDQTLETNYLNSLRLDLVRTMVSWFNIAGHEFVRLEKDSASQKMRDGFYDLAYNGKIKLLIKRVKTYSEDVKGSELEKKFVQADYYFVQRAGIYYNIRTKKSLLQLFRDKKRELESFAGKQRLKYKKNQEAYITELTRHYDQLNK